MKANTFFAKSAIFLGVISALSSANAQGEQSDGVKNDMDTITVTSRRKEESIIEVPMSISTVSALEISDRNLISADDFYRTLAGAASPRGELILRGLSGGNTAFPETTSTFVDDVPFDYDNLNDVERVEVLRGP